MVEHILTKDGFLTTVVNPVIYLNVKYGWNEILSKFLLVPKGLLNPVWWRNKRWIITRALIIKDNKKWRVKNLVNS